MADNRIMKIDSIASEADIQLLHGMKVMASTAGNTMATKNQIAQAIWIMKTIETL